MVAANSIAKPPEMIYNVYQGGGSMNVAISKWGNSLGIRIPATIVEAMNIQAGDTLSYEMKDDSFVLRKKTSTRQLFESFYGKSFDDITSEDIGKGDELDWGEDVGGEIF